MNTLHPSFKRRDFTFRPDANANIAVDSIRWDALGGCKAAEFTATGPAVGVWEFAEYLRCPVEVYDDKARACWWGYVNEVKISNGALEWGVSLEQMSNRVAVAYSWIDTGTQEVGTRRTTAWASDADSMSEFGTVEFLASASGLTDAVAITHRDTILAANKYPNGVATHVGRGGNAGAAVATINCKGWYNTLDWRYAQWWNAGTALIETTQQIVNLRNTYSQFITAVDIDTASGINLSAYRTGDTTVKEEIESLMERGTTTSRRLLATVGIDRRMLVYPEAPNTTVNYSLDRLGNLYNSSGRRVTSHMPPVGVWVKLLDVLPSTVDTSRMVNPALQFVEAAEYTNGHLIFTFRGQRTASQILGEYE